MSLNRDRSRSPRLDLAEDSDRPEDSGTVEGEELELFADISTPESGARGPRSFVGWRAGLNLEWNVYNGLKQQQEELRKLKSKIKELEENRITALNEKEKEVDGLKQRLQQNQEEFKELKENLKKENIEKEQRIKNAETKLKDQEKKTLDEQTERLKVKFQLMEAKMKLKEHEEEKERIKRDRSNEKQYQADFGEGLLDIPCAKGVVIVKVSKEILGKPGGFGLVKKLEMPSGCIFAVKIFSETVIHDDSFPKNLDSEIAILRQSNHQHVVKYYGTCSISQLSSAPILIMELLDTNFENYYMEGNPSLNLLGTIEILIQIARGLDYLHTCEPKIIHRDLSARNVLLCGDMLQPTAKITDFGLSRFVESVSITMTRRVGTPYYLAPEVDCQDPHYNEKVDIFSFGHLSLASSVKQVITSLPDIRQPDGRGGFLARTEVDIRMKYIGDLRKEIGKGHPYEDLIQACLSLISENRRPSAAELIERLTDIIETLRSNAIISGNSTSSNDSRYEGIN